MSLAVAEAEHGLTRSVLVCVQPVEAGACSDTTVTLPYHWDREHPDTGGVARFTIFFSGSPSELGEAPALYLPRVGNTFAISLNGSAVFAVGSVGSSSHDTVKRPWLITLPAHLLHSDGNRLEIVIGATAGRAAQLSGVEIGRFADLEPKFDRERLWRVQLTAAMLWTALVLGLMGLVAWWVQREPMFLCYAVAEIAWAIRLSDMFVIDMPLTWQAWGAGVAVAFGVAQLAMTQFFLHAVGRWRGWWRIGYWSYTATWLAVVPAVVWIEWRELWLAWVATGTLGFTLLAIYVGWRGFRDRHAWRWMFAALVLAASAAGAADMVESPGSMYMHPTWSRFVWLGFSLALAALVARRLWHGRQQLQLAHQELRLALERQALELEEANRRRARGELELAMEQERQRVMRDMHDVLGGRLSGLLTLAGRQGPAAAEIQSEVRVAIDELREVVSAMAPFDGNISTMLGSLRPQLERRLALVGVELTWSVDELPPSESFTPGKVQHLRRLLIEAATNVARHARARRAELVATCQGEHIELQFADDGIGFEHGEATRQGNGLKNMRWRAQALGAELRFEPRAPGTLLRLRLPV
jgi:signal transduction histidine kinase